MPLDGILLGAIARGSIDTPRTDSFDTEPKGVFRRAALLQRHVHARELADAVGYLVSGRSTFVTGATLQVNGGSLRV